MEPKPSFTAIFLLFLLLLAVPCFSTGLLPLVLILFYANIHVNLKLHLTGTSDLDSEIYDIDYRGPETHSYLPPPNLYDRKHGVHQERSMKHRRSKGLRAGHAGKRGKKHHG
ncbi:hypothetical protein RJ639_045991 [Escallonia herrerae]|uniref:Uncharacterized protein n=1 Tax=Escallonia herrerae TaxID=1293975 RepID=A0AA89B025_9ASTE|nr:hypothetical protein RJ639_045991 [Escallonia herrerae]